MPDEVADNSIFSSSLRREDDKMFLQLQVDESIEELFSDASTDRSSAWSGPSGHHTFYHIDGVPEEIEDYLRTNYPTSTDYGGDYIEGDQVNISVLRTAGISDGVEFEIPETHPESLMVKAQKDLRDTVADLYKTFVRPVVIDASLTVHESV